MTLDISQLTSKMEAISKRVSVDAIPSVKKSLESVATNYKAFNNTEHGKVINELKGGFRGLTQEIDNAVDATGSIDKPTITRFDAAAQQGLKSMRTALSSHSGDISALVSSSHGTDLSSVMPAAKAAAGAAAGLVDDIISDGAPEALAHVLTKVKGEKIQAVNGLLQEVADPAVKANVADAVGKLMKTPGLGDVSGTDLTKALGTLDDLLGKSLGGLSSGNLLKDINETLSGTLLNKVVNLSNVFKIKDANEIINPLLSGNPLDATQALISQLRLPSNLNLELLDNGIDISKATDVNDLYRKLDAASASTSPFSASTKNAAEKLKATVKKLDEEFQNTDTSIAANVSQGTPTRNPVVDPTQYNKSQSNYAAKTAAYTPQQTQQAAANPSTDLSDVQAGTGTDTGSIATGSGDGNFPFLNSREEIVKYLQSANREITTVVWHWTANYTDQGYIGSEQIDKMHRARGWAGIGYHFIVKRDGSIQIGRDINKTGAHTGGFNTRSIGISFVAGYKCTSDKYKGIPPHSEVGPESITQAQHEAFKAFMSAWYTVFPGGCAYGHVDFPKNSGKVDPGFDVGKRCYELFGKRNVGHPQKDGRILTAAEINQKRSVA